MDCSGNNLSANTPQFFKIILENTMQEGKLGIPRKFIMEYGNDLQEYVTLVVPDGANWQIKLTKTEDGQVYMEQGWLDFAKHYSISYGNFLVFKPRGISKFLVLIFDTTGLEIKYAPITTRSCNSQSDREIKLLENCEMKNAREDSPNSCPRPHKRKRSDDCIIIESSSSLGAEYGTLRQKKAKRDADLHVPLRKFKGGGLTSSSRGYKFEDAWKKRHFSVVEKAKLLERARAFRSSKPCFKVVINPTAAYRKATLHVPSAFAQKYFTQKMGNVILKNKMGRTWTANYMYKEISGKSWLRAKLTRGWKDFCVDNKLEVGDVCVFEMTKCRKMTLNVVIFRARKNMSRIPRLQPKDDGTVKRSTSKQKAKLLGKAQDLKSIKPSFKVTMHSSTVHSENKAPSMNVPAKFAKKYLTNEKGDVIIYDMKGRTWCISYYCCENRSSSQLKFIGGWKKFSEDNNLKVGDVCIFEMDNCKNITCKVIIIRKCDAVNCFPLPGYQILYVEWYN